VSHLFTPWVKKGCHPNHGYNFVNSWWICKILSLLQRAVNLQQNQYQVTHHTLSVLLHYLGKLKNQKFCILMHVKHVSNVTVYHLSNICLPSVLKINVKTNTMQNTNIFAFCSFNVHNEQKQWLIAVWFDFREDIIDTAVDQWRNRLQACIRANGGHFEHFCEKNSCKQFVFSCVFGSSGFYPLCQLSTVLMRDAR